MPKTLTLQVPFATWDGYAFNPNLATAGTNNIAGNVSGDSYGTFAFFNIDAAPLVGATIESVVLRRYSNTLIGSPTTNIYVTTEADPTPTTSYAEYHALAVSDPVAANGVIGTSQWVDVADLTSIFEPVLLTHGASLLKIGVLQMDNGSAANARYVFRSFDFDADLVDQLVITYRPRQRHTMSLGRMGRRRQVMQPRLS